MYFPRNFPKDCFQIKNQASSSWKMFALRWKLNISSSQYKQLKHETIVFCKRLLGTACIIVPQLFNTNLYVIRLFQIYTLF